MIASPPRNRLLRALPPADLGLLLPHLDPVPLGKGDVVVHPGEPFEYAYFPEGGLASVVCNTGEGRRAEVGLFGFEGMVSTALVLGADRTPHETFLQVGGTWLRIGAEIDPGVPWTHAEGAGPPMLLALKSGNFGGRDFFLQAFERLPGA